MEIEIDTDEILSDLVKINRDRVEGYIKASYDTSVPDLKSLFRNMADESRKNITELTKLLLNRNLNYTAENINTAGNIYKSWEQAKAKFVGTTTNYVLHSCEFAEAAVLTAYKEVKAYSFNTHEWELVQRHVASLKTSLEVISAYRKTYAKNEKAYS